MSRIIRDCQCGHCNAVTEHWVNSEELAVLDCPECGNAEMVALIGSPKIGYTRMATSGDRTSDSLKAVDKWQKGRAQKQAIEKRNLERHGTYD